MKLIAVMAAALSLSILMTSCSKPKNQTDSDHAASDDAALPVWRWIVNPTIEADDIQPVRYGDYVRDDNGCHYNTAGAQVYDKLSIIVNRVSDNGCDRSNDDDDRGDQLGLISYNGLSFSQYNVSDDFTYIFYVSNQKYKKYILGGEMAATINDRYEFEFDYDHVYDAPMEIQTYLRWVKKFDGLFECELGPIINPKSKIEYNEPIAVIYTDKVKKLSAKEYEAISDDKVVFVNNGKLVSDRLYEDGGYFSDGVIPLKYKGKWGYVDINGNTVLPFEFDSIDTDNQIPAFDASNGYIAVKKDDQFALYDVNGKIVINYGVFDEIRPVYEGMAWVKQKGLWGVIGLSADGSHGKVDSPAVTTEKFPAGCICDGDCFLREGPSKTENVVGIFPRDQQFTVNGYSNNWVYVKIGDIFGWIESKVICIYPNKTSDYDADKIYQSLEYAFIRNDRGYFDFRMEECIGDTISYYLTYYENTDNCKYYESAKSVFGDDDYMIEFKDAKKIDKAIYNIFHIKLSHKNKLYQYNDMAAYKNGKYYFRKMFDCNTEMTKFKIADVYQIKDDLIYVTLSSKSDSYDDPDDNVRTYSAVIYTGSSQYALLGCYFYWTSLTFTDYLYYIHDFH